MKADPSERLPDLVADALEFPAAEREAFLLRACGDDAVLLAEARSLVGDGGPGMSEFMETPAYAAAGGGLEAIGGAPTTAGGELRAGDRLGDCSVLHLLGEGGMGEVYLAEDVRLERRVAVKLLKRHPGDETLARRFQHERRVLAGLNHPNIARLYGGAVTPEGRSYLVMEYVEGERLDRFCEAQRLEAPARLQLFRKVCAAVAYAHQNLVVHRDLKPANIRVTAEGEPKLLDFGIAKLLEAENPLGGGADLTLTMFGAMTPEYASPEQLRGEPITTATDVYSLGVVLYELLCGERPYRLTSRRPDELARAICEQEPPRPSTVAQGRKAEGTETATRKAPLHPSLLRGDLDNIVAKALRKEPARRYGSVAQLAEDLRRHAEGLPVTARRDTFGYRMGKFVRRNRVGVAAAALVTLALVGGLAATSWQAHAARRERDRAQLARATAETARRQAERINEFLQRLLSSANTNQMGKDVKVVQVLDAASKDLERELASEPEVLAQVQLTLSRSYASLQTLGPAEQHGHAAHALFQRRHGDDHPATMAAAAQLGQVLSRRPRFDRAEPLLRQSLAWFERHPSFDPSLRAQTQTALANVLVETRQLIEADAMLARSLPLLMQTFGENSVEVLSALNSAGNLKRMQGDFGAAAELYRQAIEQCDQILPGSAQLLPLEGNLCIMLFALGRLPEMEQAIERLDRDRQKIVGDNNRFHRVVTGLSMLGRFAKGDYPQAIRHARRALELMDPGVPPESLDAVQTRAVLGLSLSRVGQPEEGEPLLRAAFEHGQKLDKVEFVNTIGNLPTALGECLLAQGRHPEAEALLLPGHEELAARLGNQHPRTVHAARCLRDLYTAWGKPAQAEGSASASADPAPY